MDESYIGDKTVISILMDIVQNPPPRNLKLLNEAMQCICSFVAYLTGFNQKRSLNFELITKHNFFLIITEHVLKDSNLTTEILDCALTTLWAIFNGIGDEFT